MSGEEANILGIETLVLTRNEKKYIMCNDYFTTKNKSNFQRDIIKAGLSKYYEKNKWEEQTYLNPHNKQTYAVERFFKQLLVLHFEKTKSEVKEEIMKKIMHIDLSNTSLTSQIPPNSSVNSSSVNDSSSQSSITVQTALNSLSTSSVTNVDENRTPHNPTIPNPNSNSGNSLSPENAVSNPTIQNSNNATNSISGNTISPSISTSVPPNNASPSNSTLGGTMPSSSAKSPKTSNKTSQSLKKIKKNKELEKDAFQGKFSKAKKLMKKLQKEALNEDIINDLKLKVGKNSQKLERGSNSFKEKEMEDYKDKKTQASVLMSIMGSIIGIVGLCGKNYFSFMNCFYVFFPAIFYYHLYFLIKNNIRFLDGVRRVVAALKYEAPLWMNSPESVVYYKDKLMISDKVYDAERKCWNLAYVLPALYSVKNYRAQLNKTVFDFFNITITKNGVHCDPTVLMKTAIIAAEKYRKMYENARIVGKNGRLWEKAPIIPTNLTYKFASDGFSVGKQDFTVFGFQFLNLDFYFPKKSPYSWLYSSILFSKEKLELIQEEEKKLAKFCKKRRIEIPKKNGTVDRYGLRKVYCSDLLSLEHCCEEFKCCGKCCPYCWYHRKYSRKMLHKFPRRRITNFFGFNSEDIYPCCLHGFERIMENMLYNLTRGKKKKKEQLLHIFSNHPKLKCLKFVKVDERSDVDNSNVVEKLSMITGNQISYLFAHLGIISPLFEDRTKESEKKLFEILKDIWNFVHRPVEFYQDENLKKFVALWKEFMGLIQVYTGPQYYQSIYIHIFSCHLVPCIKRLSKLGLNLLDVDQSSFELGNKILKAIQKDAISKGYSAKERKFYTTEYLMFHEMLDIEKVLHWKPQMSTEEVVLFQTQFQALQIMLYNLRRLYIAAYGECPLNDLPNFKFKPRTKRVQPDVTFIHLNNMTPISDELYKNVLNEGDVEEDFDYKAFDEGVEQQSETFVESNNNNNGQFQFATSADLLNQQNTEFDETFQEIVQLQQMVAANQIKLQQHLAAMRSTKNEEIARQMYQIQKQQEFLNEKLEERMDDLLLGMQRPLGDSTNDSSPEQQRQNAEEGNNMQAAASNSNVMQQQFDMNNFVPNIIQIPNYFLPNNINPQFLQRLSSEFNVAVGNPAPSEILFQDLNLQSQAPRQLLVQDNSGVLPQPQKNFPSLNEESGETNAAYYDASKFFNSSIVQQQDFEAEESDGDEEEEEMEEETFIMPRPEQEIVREDLEGSEENEENPFAEFFQANSSSNEVEGSQANQEDYQQEYGFSGNSAAGQTDNIFDDYQSFESRSWENMNSQVLFQQFQLINARGEKRANPEAFEVLPSKVRDVDHNFPTNRDDCT